MFFSGGLDSFNVLTPHSGCGASDLYTQYSTERGGMAIPHDQLLPLQLTTDDAVAQPCSTFGLNPELPFLKTLWDSGEASFVANMGTLIEPLTRAQYYDGSAEVPPLLFAHDAQQRQIQSVHAQEEGAKGILGRIVDALTAAPVAEGQQQPYASRVYSLSGNKKITEGGSAPYIVDWRKGVSRCAKPTSSLLSPSPPYPPEMPQHCKRV